MGRSFGGPFADEFMPGRRGFIAWENKRSSNLLTSSAVKSECRKFNFLGIVAGLLREKVNKTRPSHTKLFILPLGTHLISVTIKYANYQFEY